MDSFLTSTGGPDSLSLQEMLDMDIKSEKDLDDIFGIDTNLNFHELPALNLDEDSLGAPGDNNVWLTSSNDGSSLLGGDVSNSMSTDLNSGETRMVCPNSVMPVTLIQVPYDKTGPKSEKSLLKPGNLKLSKNCHIVPPTSLGMYSTDMEIRREEVDIKQEYESEDEEDEAEAYARAVIFKNNQNARSKVRVQESSVRTITNGVKRNISNKSVNAKRRLPEYSNGENDLNLTSSVYPKPAYSYSCLIAMALKNSPSGSLPVSEIYNFMCEHFPYFKTAPNGWKNSVRHNLSLNKCFEKIEKPATNGSQRKGCLWAMNPNKINKMDEEVQKWSKKDKTAIRKSMICPESLDALERGQLAVEVLPISEAESDEEVWDGDGGRIWSFKQEEGTEEEEEEEEDDEDEDEGKPWADGRLPARLSSDAILSAFPANGDDYDSDISLTDFDIEVAESIYNDTDPSAGKVNVRVKVATSPNGAFQPLLSGAYTVNSQGTSETSPKRFKTLGGSTITGNYVYKPLGTSSIRRKSPMRHSLLSSLEADD